ncbi:isochorismatase family protein [Brachyspira hyodysenteriae]|nr:isochorismatase family protein [Brachyspira hyodysenteriae]MCZ9893415.1 isochorismatase family protein [Brachyspira hyodysenteriae]MCZ9990959.1 isochorismatase family protein [Brachyspira hyodysenteriae]MCZ9999322.1 isochorismatase family protein [Brachyspira hyodysenteriae]MDA0002045.1 isochorismatase family protein [Brachyspira hyodysenteriae]MDA0007763.1 isochorismatase family protein [Brachyspira hyodysenteriae]
MSKIKILTIVDMQNDYMEGGPMAVKGATKLVPVINDLIKEWGV